MIYSLRGSLIAKKDEFAVINVSGIGFRVFLSERDRGSLPQLGAEVNFFCVANIKQDGINIYGFSDERELALFELLDSVSGVGPKSALNLFKVAPAEQIVAAIVEGKTELLSQSSGIGRKTAGRIVLELREKLANSDSALLVRDMELHADVEQALVGLGYSRYQVRDALRKLDSSVTDTGDKIKESLRYLKNV